MNPQIFLLLYIIVINIIAFLVMWYDKKMALDSKWRIPEKELFMLAFLFGSIGIYLGMYRFRHKTKHKTFTIGIPIIFVINIILAIGIIKYVFM